ncbi:hypothetical protein I7I50_00091 [Histoplasma capsulatum G186AR]|uniref:Uncharacterized protein n=1 Tax=Ajellomyces capsulatus TaxID=5037 RepID=A0A8H7YDF0_AJECA|nr:hypothetical protein I7I52_07360 [Histoplasma capsulatum]QSS72291.1 hypothetical protein I7I50_00091 [Histoplasma capsulatum G186AR]
MGVNVPAILLGDDSPALWSSALASGIFSSSSALSFSSSLLLSLACIVVRQVSRRRSWRLKLSTPPHASMFWIVSIARSHWRNGHSAVRYLARW